MYVSSTSASLLCFLRALNHSSPILRSSKLKFSCSSSGPQSFLALVFTRLFYFGISFTVSVIRAFRYLPSGGYFLVPWNLTRPAPPPRAVDRVDFVDLDCAYITLHEFILCPGPCRGYTGLVFFVTSYEGFAAWFTPVLSNLSYWCLTLYCLVFCYGLYFYPGFCRSL